MLPMLLLRRRQTAAMMASCMKADILRLLRHIDYAAYAFDTDIIVTPIPFHFLFTHSLLRHCR